MIRLIEKALAPAKMAIRNMVARGVLQLVNDSAKMQGLQVTLLADETRELERFQNYGFTSHAPLGAEVLALFLNGNRDHGVIIAIEDKASRKTGLLEGDVAYDTRRLDTLLFAIDLYRPAGKVSFKFDYVWQQFDGLAKADRAALAAIQVNSFLLGEDGSRILNEDGGGILLED